MRPHSELKNDKSTIEYAPKRVESNAFVFGDGTLGRGFGIIKNSYQQGSIGTSLMLRFLVNRVRYNKVGIERAIWCTDEWSHGYFHWFVDVLQRYFSVEYHDDYVLLLPQRYAEIAYVTESLKWLKISHRFIGPKEIVHVGKLVLPTYYKPRGTVFKSLINHIASVVKHDGNIERSRVYISRKYAHRRKVSNEDEVFQVMDCQGFRIVYLEQLSWLEQLGILKKTSIIVGLHGAGLTNMLFMPPGSTVLEIKMTGSDKQVCYKELANALGHQYNLLWAPPDDSNADPHTGNVIVNTDKLKHIIKHLVS